MTSTSTPAQQSPREHLSYKFQRLRERLRQAIASGELSGKLPGERELAKRFKANPKTLSKALTDLAAEGLLDRSIGRGTYVKGSEEHKSGGMAGRWLILCDAAERSSAVVEGLLEANPDAEVVTAGNDMRPSFISQFGAVIDLSRHAPANFHRDLIVRGISVLRVGMEPAGLKVHAVLLDRAHAAACVARDIFLAGHRKVLVVENGDQVVSNAVRIAAGRYAPHSAVQSVTPETVAAVVDGATTAVICDGEAVAEQVVRIAQMHAQLSRCALAAVGVSAGEPPCTGIYAPAAELVSAAAHLLQSAAAHRPTVLWLTGTFVERGTIRPVAEQRYEGDGPRAAIVA